MRDFTIVCALRTEVVRSYGGRGGNVLAMTQRGGVLDCGGRRRRLLLCVRGLCVYVWRWWCFVGEMVWWWELGECITTGWANWPR